MSAATVVILIGVLLLLIAIVDSIPFGGKNLGLMSTKLRIPLGALGILLIIFGGYTYGANKAVALQGQLEQAVVGNKLAVDYPVERVQVISPIEDDSVKCRILTMGVYPESHTADIWVVLKPSDDKYYPQSDHTNTSYKRGGEWQVITRFGGDQGEAYELIVYETDAAASQFFSTTIEEWKAQEDYPGLELADLPSGAREIDRITVYLLDNCRGVF
jgi:hypothetical protein